jgi:hypothetical protein
LHSTEKQTQLTPILDLNPDACAATKEYGRANLGTMSVPDGETAIVPKDEGAGIMISAFQSREFGFGLHMSEQELALVNEYRRDKKYQDEEAAKAKGGDAKKKPPTKSPFILEFEYGASGEGYWVYKHMVLQSEDCTDCQKVLYPEHEFLFLLDHSCGHDRQRNDGLKVENTSS